LFSILGENKKIIKNASLFEDIKFNFIVQSKNLPLIEKFLTNDAKTIRTRQEIFTEITENDYLMDFFEKLNSNITLMNEYSQKVRYFPEKANNESLYYSFREFLIFIDTIELIFKNLGNTKSYNLIALYNRAKSVRNSVWYSNAKAYISNIDANLRNIKSVLIGINLNSQLSPFEAGIVSISDKPFVSNSLFDKLFSSRTEDNKYICIAPLEIKENSQGQLFKGLNMSIYSALNDIVGGSLRKIRKILEIEFIGNSDFLFDIYEEIKFIDICIKYISRVQKSGLNLCLPDISAEHKIEGLYNLELVYSEKSKTIISNDVFFDHNGKIHILSGANSGGKSVYLRSVGVAQILFQLGIPIPAKSAKMKIYNSIFSCFRNKIKDVMGGSFENECRSIAEIIKNISKDSLILFDEVFSTTNSYDAYLIAKKMLEYIAKSGCFMIYVTHIHELINNIDYINSIDGIKSKIDFLSTECNDGEKSYRIIRGKGEYFSAVNDILKNCGLDFLV